MSSIKEGDILYVLFSYNEDQTVSNYIYDQYIKHLDFSNQLEDINKYKVTYNNLYDDDKKNVKITNKNLLNEENKYFIIKYMQYNYPWIDWFLLIFNKIKVLKVTKNIDSNTITYQETILDENEERNLNAKSKNRRVNPSEIELFDADYCNTTNIQYVRESLWYKEGDIIKLDSNYEFKDTTNSKEYDPELVSEFKDYTFSYITLAKIKTLKKLTTNPYIRATCIYYIRLCSLNFESKKDDEPYIYITNPEFLLDKFGLSSNTLNPVVIPIKQQNILRQAPSQQAPSQQASIPNQILPALNKNGWIDTAVKYFQNIMTNVNNNQNNRKRPAQDSIQTLQQSQVSESIGLQADLKGYTVEQIKRGINILSNNISDLILTSESVNAVIKKYDNLFLKIQVSKYADDIDCDILVMDVLKDFDYFIKYKDSFPVIIYGSSPKNYKLSNHYSKGSIGSTGSTAETKKAKGNPTPKILPATVTSEIQISRHEKNLEDFLVSDKSFDVIIKLLNDLFISMIKASIKKRFVHNDAHAGNILYDNIIKKFILIDFGRSYVDLSNSNFDILNNIKNSNDPELIKENYYDIRENRWRIIPHKYLKVPCLCDIAAICFQLYKEKYTTLLHTNSTVLDLLKLEISKKDSKKLKSLIIPKDITTLYSIFTKLTNNKTLLTLDTLLFIYGIAWFVEYLLIFIHINNITVTVENENYIKIVSNKIFPINDKTFDSSNPNVPFVNEKTGIFFGITFNNLQKHILKSQIQIKLYEMFPSYKGGAKEETNASTSKQNTLKCDEIDIEKLQEDMTTFEELIDDIYKTNLKYEINSSKYLKKDIISSLSLSPTNPIKPTDILINSAARTAAPTAGGKLKSKKL